MYYTYLKRDKVFVFSFFGKDFGSGPGFLEVSGDFCIGAWFLLSTYEKAPTQKTQAS